MPPLKSPTEKNYVQLPPRKALIAQRTQVLVVGGGPAGIGAAIGAAQAGADVTLVERYGFFGGNMTVALVSPLMSFYTQQNKPEVHGSTVLFPTDHGEGKSVIAGVVEELVESLVKEGGALPPVKENGYVIPFDPEIMKTVALKMLDKYNIKYLLHAFASDVLHNSEIPGVVFETKSGPLVIQADVIVDCTGDGDIAVLSGAGFYIGRHSDHLTQPMTLYFRMVNFNYEQFKQYVHANPSEWRGVHGLWKLIHKAKIEHNIDLPREDILMFGSPHDSEVSLNSTRVIRVLGTDVFDLTLAESTARYQMQEVVNFLTKWVPGFQAAYLIQSGSQVGIRETRRIKGDYVLTVDDILSARQFEDCIARSTYPVDIHNPEGKGTHIRRIPEGKAYDIPLRCLFPRGIDHLLVAGRCISGTHEAHSSYRVMPTAMATGQGAGVCAALAAKTKTGVRQVPYADIRKELIRQGADLNS